MGLHWRNNESDPIDTALFLTDQLAKTKFEENFNGLKLNDVKVIT